MPLNVGTSVQRILPTLSGCPTLSDYEVLTTLLITIIQVYVGAEHVHENTCTNCSTVQVNSADRYTCTIIRVRTVIYIHAHVSKRTDLSLSDRDPD